MLKTFLTRSCAARSGFLLNQSIQNPITVSSIYTSRTLFWRRKKNEKPMPAAPAELKHFKNVEEPKIQVEEHTLPHPIWSEEAAEKVAVTHQKPSGVTDRCAYYTVKIMRKSFDFLSGYTIGKHMESLDERSVLNRCIFLETVAGVPGFTAAQVRHFHSLRRMQRDHGWIHTLLEEAENERMHLMTFIELKKPTTLFRWAVATTQFVFSIYFYIAYLINPKFCHKFVGYLEEEAVVTYTHILEQLDKGALPMWKHLPAPEIAIDYWKLSKDAMMKDVILAIRADEAHHRDVNHTLASLKLRQPNPFKPGE